MVSTACMFDMIKELYLAKSLSNVIDTDVTKVSKEEYVSDIIAKAMEAKFPLAVINEDNKLERIILRVRIFSGLVSDDVDES